MKTCPNTTHHTSLVPVYYWCGARPHLTDLESDQTGWLTCLCLHREGDLCLLPLAWQVNAPDEDDPLTPNVFPYPTITTKALDETAVSLTLHQLQQDGWRINGQLTLTFTGCDAVPDFTQAYRQYLWQTPAPKDAEESDLS